MCLLGDDQEHVARRFAAPGDRFDGVPCETSPTDIVVGELLRARALTARPPLIHHRGGYTTVAPIDRARRDLAA